MTFKDLKKRVSATHEVQQQTRLFERIRDKSFWIWDVRQHKQVDIETHADCCFNRIFGFLQALSSLDKKHIYFTVHIKY